jgi:hypothetical protein
MPLRNLVEGFPWSPLLTNAIEYLYMGLILLEKNHMANHSGRIPWYLVAYLFDVLGKLIYARFIVGAASYGIIYHCIRSL